jgi:DNA-binding NarL/FixJ family response regulator
MWAAFDARNSEIGIPDLALEAHKRQEPLRRARQALGAGQVRAAEERGAAVTLGTATEFAATVSASEPQAPPAPAPLSQLSSREQELVILVAKGLTDAQIGAELFISVSTVRSHLDRVRDKTSCGAEPT